MGCLVEVGERAFQDDLFAGGSQGPGDLAEGAVGAGAVGVQAGQVFCEVAGDACGAGGIGLVERLEGSAGQVFGHCYVSWVVPLRFVGPEDAGGPDADALQFALCVEETLQPRCGCEGVAGVVLRFGPEVLAVGPAVDDDAGPVRLIEMDPVDALLAASAEPVHLGDQALRVQAR